jgi:tetratricopeptide (TPR) repeat protein
MKTFIKSAACMLVFGGLFFVAGCMAIQSPLLQASAKGDHQAVKAALDNGANVNETTGWHAYTPLMMASANGQAETVTLLLSRGADVNIKRFNFTALGEAAAAGHSKIVDLLMDNGANVDWAISGLDERIKILSEPPVLTPKQIADCQRGVALLRQRQLTASARNGWKCFNRGQYEKGITAFKQAIQQNPADVEAFAGLAGCHNALGQYDDAIASARQCMTLAPQAPIGHIWMGRIFVNKKRYAEAEKEFKQAIDLAPNDAEVQRYAAAAYWKSYRYEEALAAWVRADQMLPADSPAKADILRSTMLSRYALGQFSEAVAEADQLLALVSAKPDQNNAAWAHAIKSLASRQQGDFVQAAENAHKAVELNPSEVLSQLAAGLTAIDNGQFEEAVKSLSVQLTNNIYLALAYAKLGRPEVAAKVYIEDCDGELIQKSVPGAGARQEFLVAMRPYKEKLLQEAKQLEVAQQPDVALAALVKAAALAEESDAGKLQGELLQMAQKYQVKEPEDGYRFSKRGDVLIADGNLEGALDEYVKALRKAPYSPRLYFNTALICGKLADYPKAIRHMKTYLELAPNTPNSQVAKDSIIEWELKSERK